MEPEFCNKLMTENGQGAGLPPVMMQFFIGNPWVPKFRGKGSDTQLGERKANLKTMFRLQNISAGHRVDYILRCLEGDAKREILILPERERRSADQVFEASDKLYGNQVPASVLRSLFFSCKQEAQEGVQGFALRLQELLNGLKKRDPGGIGDEDVHLSDHDIAGSTRMAPGLEDLCQRSQVQESSSPWAAQSYRFEKKMGLKILCRLNRRKFNAVTHEDAYPLPCIEESLTSLKQACWFTTLDIASGYWQVGMTPEDCKNCCLTACHLVSAIPLQPFRG